MGQFKSFTIIIFVFIFHYGCSSVGSRVIYQSEQKISPKILGYTDLVNKTEIVKIDSSYSNIFNKSIRNELKIVNIKAINISLKNQIDFDNIRPSAVKQICIENKLDGILFTKMEFLSVKYNNHKKEYKIDPNNKTDIKLFNSFGELIIHTRHNTYTGNSYTTMPDKEVFITDGATGSLKKLIKTKSL